MSAGTEPAFHLVRQGYDIDQVNDFLRAQAAAWAEAVQSAGARGQEAEDATGRVRRAAQTRIDELEAHLAHLTKESSRRISTLQAQLGELQNVQDDIDQVHQQQEALTAALQTATKARDEMIEAADVDIAERYATAQTATKALHERAAANREQAAVDAAQIVKKAQAEAAKVRDEMIEAADVDIAERYATAKAATKALHERAAANREQAAVDAAQIVRKAQAEAATIMQRAQADIEARGRESEAAIRARSVEAEDQLAAKLEQPKKQAVELKRQVGQLTTQRNQLVRSLEAIATAGLQAHYGMEPNTDVGAQEVIDLSNSVTIAGG